MKPVRSKRREPSDCPRTAVAIAKEAPILVIVMKLALRIIKPKAPPNQKYQGAFVLCACFPDLRRIPSKIRVITIIPMPWLKRNETAMVETSPK